MATWIANGTPGTTSAGLPAGATSGDTVVVCAYRNAATAPTLPAGWTQATASATNPSHLVAYRKYDGVWTMPTFTNAARCDSVLIRPASNRSLMHGTVLSEAKNQSNVAWGAITPQVTDGTSVILRGVSHTRPDGTSGSAFPLPTGHTLISQTGVQPGYGSWRKDSSTAAGAVTITISRNTTYTVHTTEFRDFDPTATLAVTDGRDTMAATGVVPSSATLAVTDGIDTIVATATSTSTGAAVSFRAGSSVAYGTRANTTGTKPTGTTTGDMMVAFHAVGGTGTSGPTVTGPSGWTLQSTAVFGLTVDNFAVRLTMWTAPDTVSDLTWVHASNGSTLWIGTYIDVDTTTPMDVTPSSTVTAFASISNGATAAATSITTVTNNTMLVIGRGTWDGNAITPPGSWNERFDATLEWTGDIAQVTAGATGTVNVPAGNNGITNPWGIILGALRPTGGGLSTATLAVTDGRDTMIASEAPASIATLAVTDGTDTIATTATATAPSGTLVTDDFNRADTTTLGPNWTVISSGGTVNISSNRAQGPSGASMSFWNADTFADDQFCEGDFTLGTGEVGPMVRCVAGEPFSGYLVDWYSAAGGTLQWFRRLSEFGFTSLGAAATGVGTSGTKHLRLEVTGTTLTLYSGGVFVASITDATHASGAPGLWMDSPSSYVDNFEGGDLGAGPATYTATLAVTDGTDTFAATATFGPTATLAQTDGRDTFAATATVTSTATLAATDGTDTFAATATFTSTATLTATDGRDTFAATAVVTSTATLAQTDGRDTFAATPTFGPTATLAITDGIDTIVATGQTTAPTFTSTLVATDGIDTFAGAATAGAPGVDSTLVITDGRDTFAAVPTFGPTSTLAVTDGRDTIVASGQSTAPTFTATLAQTDGRDTFVAAPTFGPTATLAATDGRDTIVATATATPIGSSVLVATDGRDTIVASAQATAPTFTASLFVTDGRDLIAAVAGGIGGIILNDADAVYLGADTVDTIYAGATQVWP